MHGKPRLEQLPSHSAEPAILPKRATGAVLTWLWILAAATALTVLLHSPSALACHTGSVADWSYCTTECPCDEGDGWCHSDEQCAAGLLCVENVGSYQGLNYAVDICQVDCHAGDPGGYDYCSPDCPCDNGEGDCDSDEDCSEGNDCVADNGEYFGYGDYIDACETHLDNVPDVVFLVTGQSNVTGSNTTDIDDPANATDVHALEWNGCLWGLARLNRPDGVTPQPNSAFYAVKAFAAAHPEWAVGVVAEAEGAYSIVNWLGEDSSNIYHTTLMSVEASLEAAGLDAIFAVIWVQGEADSNDFESADAYADRLDEVITSYKAEAFWGSNTVFVATKTAKETPFSDTVKAAIMALNSDAYDDTHAVDTTGLALLPDGIHFTDVRIPRPGLPVVRCHRSNPELRGAAFHLSYLWEAKLH